MKPPPVLKAGDDPPLHTLKPLTQCKRDGTPYARFADVESEIESVTATVPDTWEVTKLKSETLVYLVRWLWPQGGDKALGRIIDCLGRRIARITRDFMGDLAEPVAEELVFEITQDVNLKIFALTASRQSEFLEVAFRTAIRRRVINTVEKHVDRSHTEVTERDYTSNIPASTSIRRWRRWLSREWAEVGRAFSNGLLRRLRQRLSDRETIFEKKSPVMSIAA